jgi:F-type H+-transporting ATPase subunit epsilon
MKLTVITLKGVQFEGEISSLNAKTVAGEITVLDHHRPLISILKNGDLKIVGKDGKIKNISAPSGFLEIRPGNEASVIVG